MKFLQRTPAKTAKTAKVECWESAGMESLATLATLAAYPSENSQPSGYDALVNSKKGKKYSRTVGREPPQVS